MKVTKLTPLGARLVTAFVLVVVVSMSVPSMYILRVLFSRVYQESFQKMKSDLAVADLVFEQEKRRMQRFARTIARDEHGERMVAFRLGVPLAHRMRNFLEGNPPGEITGLTVVDRDGVVLYRSHQEFSTGDYAGDDSFISLALLGKEAAAFERVPPENIEKEVGEAQIKRKSGAPILILKAAAPIILHGSFMGSPTMKPGRSIQEGEIVGAVAVTYLMDTDREIIRQIAARTRDSAVLYLGNTPLNFSSREWEGRTTAQLTEGKGPRTSGVVNYRRLGEIAGYTPVEDLLGNAIGSFELRTSTRSIQAARRQAVLTIALFVVTGLAISFTLGYFLAQKITGPIIELQKGAKEIGGGNLLYRINSSGSDEIAALGRSFNEMGAQLYLSMEQMRLSKIQLEEYSGRLQEAHRKLEQRSRELEQVNQQLFDSNIKLQKANEVKDTFLSTVSHELKTPLTTILGYVSMMLKGAYGGLDSELQDSLEIVLRRARNLRDLIGDLLSLSHIDSGRLELRRRYYDISRDIRGVEEVFMDRFREKDISLEVRLDEHLPQVYADSDRINQVLFNLVGNAVKFTPAGGRITIAAEYQPEANNIVVSVRDTGIGMEHGELGHIFERFYQIDKRDGRQFGGTGLGLAISRELVQLHGGGIWVESRENEGSVFYFTLPIS